LKAGLRIAEALLDHDDVKDGGGRAKREEECKKIIELLKDRKERAKDKKSLQKDKQAGKEKYPDRTWAVRGY
jgi:hypothetical protein